MYIRIRHYRLKDPEEAARRAKESCVPLLRQIPGFLGYYIVREVEGKTASVSIFETRKGAQEASRLSARWSREHLEEPLGAGLIVAGEAVLAEVAEREHEQRRAA